MRCLDIAIQVYQILTIPAGHPTTVTILLSCRLPEYCLHWKHAHVFRFRHSAQQPRKEFRADRRPTFVFKAVKIENEPSSILF